MTLRKLLVLATALLAFAGCSTTRQRRDASLREQLDAYRLPRPLAQAWPVALRVVSEHGYELVGKDRLAAARPEQGDLGKLFARGFESRTVGPGQWAAETDRNGQQVRYRVLGTEISKESCHIEYIAVQGNDYGGPEAEDRDVELELSLVRAVDAGRAAEMLDLAERRAGRK